MTASFVTVRGGLDAVDVALPDWALEALEALDPEELSARIIERRPTLGLSEQGDRLRSSMAVVEGVRESIVLLRSSLLSQTPIDQMSSGPIAPAALRTHLEVSPQALQQVFRNTLRAVLEEWLAVTRKAIERGDVRLDEALPTLDALAARLFDFVDQVLAEITATHAAEAERLRLSKADLRRLELRSFLDDESTLEEEELAEILSYPVRDAHLAIVFPRTRESDARQIAGTLRAVSLAPSFLVYPLGFATTAVWLSKPLAWTEKSISAVLRSLEELGTEASVSTVREGLGGLKRSLEEAMSVETVRTSSGPQAAAVLGYSEISVEALGLADPGAARRIVRDELGELAAPTELAAQLRATLLAWFDSGSHVSAAARLNLHEHTVRNRLRKIEGIIGRPLMARQAEMQVALRLHRVVGVAEDDTGGTAMPPPIDELAARRTG